MRHAFLLGLLVSAMGPAALADKADVIWPECYCTDRTGARVELGEVICMFVDGRSFQARCEMSLNNPMWRETDGTCMSSHNSGPQKPQPIGHTSLVHAQI